ncbi:MAG: hypothetical protein RLZZ76_630, partial [Candidatus Parcubacteria bacterium]
TYIFLHNGFIFIFYVLMLCFALFSIATMYHWFTFGSNARVSTLSTIVYVLGGVPLFILMTVFLALM